MENRRGARPALRLLSLLFAMALALGGIGVKLFQLQVVNGSKYRKLGTLQRIRHLELQARRGGIFDRNGVPLALSVEARAVYVDPRLVDDPAGEASALSQVLHLNQATLLSKLTRPKTEFVYIARGLDLSVAARVQALNLHGIGLLAESKRVYPQGALAGQVIGFVGIDGHGLGGIEAGFDAQLAGTAGTEDIEEDPQGAPIPNGLRSIVASKRGSDIVLSIDRDVQFQAEQALADAIAKTGSTEGVAIVLDAQTNDVLAMANYPTFNPAQLATSTDAQRRNRAVQDSYEPGSVNKLVTAASALETGIVKPWDVFTVPDSLRVSDGVFHDFETHGTWTIPYTKILEQSSNIGTIEAAQRLGAANVFHMLDRFGLGHTTGVEFPGESPGISLPLDQWSGTSIATIPTGQGIAVTPLQMVNVYSTIARDGMWAQPRLVKQIGGVDLAPARPERRVISAFTASQLRGMLLDVVENGTGRTARIPGYLIGGKTGTARKPIPGKLGYSNNVITTFIGMTPIAKPRFVVGVVLDSPDIHMAAVTAAPAFQRITSFVLARWGVPPQVIPTGTDAKLALQVAQAPAPQTNALPAPTASTSPSPSPSPKSSSSSGGKSPPSTPPKKKKSTPTKPKPHGKARKIRLLQ
ncbi:MAG: peptidoglycan D,D-transpeptidase FtsI family protein [Actinomycetota bacterium]